MFLAVMAVWLAISTAQAVSPDEMLADKTLESRARSISAELRCLVCQNQSIDDSDAPLAKDLRVLVRERLTKGASDREVIDYIVDRYGEFVLLRPRFGPHTVILWLSPVVLLLATLGFIFARVRRRSVKPDVRTSLNPDEEARLKRLLDGT